MNTITVTHGVLVEAANFLENDSNFSEIIIRNMSFLAKLNEVSLLLLAKKNVASVLTRDRKL
jgi:hypothetical protein